MPRDGRQTTRLILGLTTGLLLATACSHQSAAPVSDALDQRGSDKQGRVATDNDPVRASPQRRLYQYLNQWRGVPHRYGGLDRHGVDCSGLVYRAYKDLYGIDLPRTTKQQARRGRGVPAAELKAGDLVFFKTGLFQRHVGIYVGEQSFVHAARSTGVTRTSLRDPYWSDRYWKARRILDSD